MDFLTCVVNIPPERITLPSDTSFNVSCDTLAMQKLKEGSGTYVTTNGFLGPCSPANELSALHTTNNKDYLTLHQS